ncbi:MAG: glycosyltransferase family 39 protein [Planctomycetota bacterium]
MKPQVIGMTSMIRPPSSWKAQTWMRILLLLAGAAVFIWKISIAGHIRFIGSGDPAGYAEMAQSLLNGRGFEVNYISMHFLKFSPEISHPEDTWPPLYPLLIAPFFAFLSVSAFAAKLPSLLIACFAFPLATFSLGLHVSRSSLVGLVSALTVLLYLPFFCWSLQAFADITFGFLMITAVLYTLKGFENPRWFFAMGTMLALAYYAKVSALAISSGFIVYYLARSWVDRNTLKSSRSSLYFTLSMILFVVLISPWWIRNLKHFNDPMYSNHKQVVGFIGWEPWEERTYGLYWKTTPPGLAEKLNDPGRLAETSLSYLGQYFRYLFLDLPHLQNLRRFQDVKPFSLKDISTYWTGLPAVLGLLLYLVRIVPAVKRRARAGARIHDRGQTGSVFIRPGYGLFALTSLFLILPLSILWVPLARLTTPAVPLVIIMGWATVHSLTVQWVRTRFSGAVTGGLIIALFAFWAVHEGTEIVEAQANERFPWKEDSLSLMAVGNWLHTHAPGSVTMTQNPWELRFYSKGKAVRLPEASLKEVIEVARYYRVTHIIPDGFDRTLFPWIQGKLPGLTRVFSTPGLELFEIDYSRLDEDEALPLKHGKESEGNLKR